MARFHFPIIDGVRLEDPVGIDLPNAEAARAHAEVIARHMPNTANRHISVVTESGVELHQVSVPKKP